MNSSTISPMAFFKGALLAAALLLAVAIGAAVAFGRSDAVVSLGAGAGIAMASFAVLVFVIVRSIGGRRGAGWVAALGMIKMGILGALLWWLFRRGGVEPLAFMGGFSTMVVALMIEGLRRRP